MGKVVSLSQLQAELAPIRDGRTVVTTNGCFDILHVGHLRYLTAARALGDVLVVALNSDRSVRGLKGPNRPVVPESDRGELLAGLSCVDYVVLFDEETPVRLLQEIRPDVHVKGAQYTAENLPEADALREMGTRIEFLPMIEGRSSTNIIERIKQTSSCSSSTP